MSDPDKMTKAELRVLAAQQARERSEAALQKSRDQAKQAAKDKPAEPDPKHPVIQTGKGLTDG